MFSFLRKILLAAAFAAVALATPLAAQSRDMGLKQLDTAEAAAVLDAFRAYRFPADYCLRIDIIHKPRKSEDETRFSGTLWGTSDAEGVLLRLDVGAAGTPEAERKRFLIRGGKAPQLWTLDAEGKPEKIDAAGTRPFFSGLVFTPFDLQTPFLFWEKCEYDGTRRYRARPVHFFRMFPPADFSEKIDSEIGSVRIGFDRVYNALVVAEARSRDGERLKTFTLGSIRKTQGLYMFKELELRDEKTRDRDTLVVRAAALRLRFAPELFTPEFLAKPMPSLPEALFESAD
ncbi:MAG: hypothetical protein ACI4QA_02535 [Candidatus Spyradosoma sp.]